jgi:hypothetical protein
MGFLFTVALMAGLFLAIQLLWFPRSRLAWAADRVRRGERFGDGEQPVTAGDRSGEAVEMTVDWGLFTAGFIRQRLDALAEELERLDRDREIFAKAFHTTVARSAYEALLAEASRVSNQPWRHAGPMIDFEVLEVGPSTGPSEELQL